MRRADYIHKIENYKHHAVIVIEDLNMGNVSVTNSIEQVVEEIADLEKINPEEHVIVYMDSEGRWDGWDASSKDFIPLNGSSWKDAMWKHGLKVLQ